MSIHNTLFTLCCVSLLSVGCGEVPEPSELQQNMTLAESSRSEDINSAPDAESQNKNNPSSYGCDPRFGSTGLTRIDMTAYPTYSQRETWCSVGTVLPVGCYFGRHVVYQTIKSSRCNKPVAGSCYVPSAEWEVTCNTWVECRYNCDGDCIQNIC